MGGQVIMLFDGDCGFCTTVANWWQQHLASGQNGVAIAFQQVPDLSKYAVTAEEAAQALHVVTPDGVFVGGEAVIMAFEALKVPWNIIGKLGKNPIGRTIANWIYPFVARHRHQLPGATASCEIPAL